MSANSNIGADGYGGSKFSRLIRKCNDFRSTPAAVLIVSTMAVFADTVVYGLIVPFLPEILQDKLGMSSSANGILFGCFGIGVLVGAPVSAYISDRWKIRKWPMIIGLVGLGATSVLFAFADAFWELVVARLAQGISSGITWAVGLGMIADVYAGEAIGKAMGIAFSGFTLGYLGGPVLGGVIYGAGGTHAIAIFVAAITVVDLVFRLVLKEPKDVLSAVASKNASMANLELAQQEKLLGTTSCCPSVRNSIDCGIVQGSSVNAVAPLPTLIASPAVAGKSADIINVSSGLAAVNRIQADSDVKSLQEKGKPSDNKPSETAQDIEKAESMLHKSSSKRRTTMLDLLKEWPILACCLATITVTGASGSFESTLPIHLAEKYNTSSTIIGVVFIAIVVPSVVVGPLSGKFADNERALSRLAPYGRFGFIIIGSLAAAIAIACLGATRNMAGLVVSLVFVGTLAGFAAVPIMSIMGVHVHRMGGDAYAKVYALFNIAYSVGVIIIPTVLPPIMNAVGFAATMGVVASILVFGAIVLSIIPTYQLFKYGRSAFIGDDPRLFL
ncbi:hypothetical protein J3B02_003136 [Coemansia erecta]|uniref:Major facilitator superfamily (MFS) profile domain-containing protein n=1 Tax=Coemansia asiatica TaxID=1052880 RepID=A0A9W7XRJ9_9FUNG|nr:hypothetical protein LPJ64_000432 [Coemansia asiatica]KAJ2853453.1 hypothetical protein J3B02_003136 [Coemansia erecta]KAJ2880257.1 hypothetical protein FB639_002879 [Coemansia asiatica]